MIVTERVFYMTKGREKVEKISGEEQTGKPGQIVCAGSSLMEVFPVEEFVKKGTRIFFL